MSGRSILGGGLVGASKQTNGLSHPRGEKSRSEKGMRGPHRIDAPTFRRSSLDFGGEFFPPAVVHVSLSELDGGQRNRLRIRVGCRNDGGEIRSLPEIVGRMNIRQTSRASGISDEENREWDGGQGGGAIDILFHVLIY